MKLETVEQPEGFEEMSPALKLSIYINLFIALATWALKVPFLGPKLKNTLRDAITVARLFSEKYR